MTEKKGYNIASSRIYWLKALPNTKIVPLDKNHDEIAFAAASVYKKFKEHGLRDAGERRKLINLESQNI